MQIQAIYRCTGAVVSNLFGTRDQFRGRQFFHGSEREVMRSRGAVMVYVVMQVMEIDGSSR